jgi:hypothetical protein
MKNIDSKESQLRDHSIDGAVCEMASQFKMLNEQAHLVPLDISRIFVAYAASNAPMAFHNLALYMLSIALLMFSNASIFVFPFSFNR